MGLACFLRKNLRHVLEVLPRTVLLTLLCQIVGAILCAACHGTISILSRYSNRVFTGFTLAEKAGTPLVEKTAEEASLLLAPLLILVILSASIAFISFLPTNVG